MAFDPDTAVNAAMRVFWLKGYEGASMNELTEAMGINKPSLYAKYGDKRGLFLAAMDHYIETISAAHLKPLVENLTIRDAIQGYYASINGAIAGTGTPPGCLIGTVATDLAGRDEDIRVRAASLVASAEAFLTQRFQQLGGSPIDEATLAELVVSVGQSLAARARTGATTEELNAVSERFLAAIFDQREPTAPD